MNDYEFNEVVAVSRAATREAIEAAIAVNEGRLRAVEEMGPAFEQFYGTESYIEAMSKHPKLAQAVVAAESDLLLQASHLPDLYATLWDVAIATGQAPQAPHHTGQPQADDEAKSSFMAAQQSKQDDLSRSRRALIEKLESEGIQDVDFDSVIAPSL